MQDWSITATFSWTTTGLTAGDYMIESEARNGASGTYQSYVDISYPLTP